MTTAPEPDRLVVSPAMRDLIEEREVAAVEATAKLEALRAARIESIARSQTDSINRESKRDRKRKRKRDEARQSRRRNR